MTAGSSISRRAWAAVAAVLLIAAGVSGCGDPDTSRPASLTAPNAIELVQRPECGSQSPLLSQFNESGGCDIGLIVNLHKNRLAFADLGREEPRLADLESDTPGVNHLRVGERPVAVSADEAGTTAFTLNQTDASISVVDLWRISNIDTIEVPEGPQTLEAVPGDGPNGVSWLVTTTREPDQITFRPGVRCYQDAEAVPSDAPEVTSACVGRDIETDQIPLPGRPSTSAVGPDDDRVYVGYHNRPYVSVVVPPERDDVLADENLTCRGGRSASPCIVDRIGTTYGCSDGVDNDGDGDVDQQDLQCFGPMGAESPDGVGRTPQGACSNGVDDDGDGDVDRADDECLTPGGSESSFPAGADGRTACSNGEDDDGDGEVDTQDSDCYGRFGQREAPVEVSGIDDLEVGSAGNFAYAVDRANNQVLTIDTRRGQLIDAAAAVSPERTSFTDDLGIPLGGSPLAVTPYVTRSVQWQDSNNSGHAIIAHTYGAYATADNGSVYFVEAVRTSCEVTEPSGELLTDAEFRARGEAFRMSAESDCLELPAFPIESDESSDACQSASDCRSCLSGDAPSSADCAMQCESFLEDRHNCRVSGRTSEPGDNVELATNPTFEVRDAPGQSGGPPGRVVGAGTCTEPSEYLEALQTYRRDNPDSVQSLGCESPLRPQPLSIAADLSDRMTFEDVPRMDLLQRAELVFQPPSEAGGEVESVVATAPYDVRLRNETLRVIWEGILPSSRRGDGIVASASRDLIKTGGLNACDVGIREGDVLQILSEPKTGSEAPGSCSALRGGDNTPGAEVRSWRVTSVRPDEVQIEVISESDTATGELPASGCYPDGLTYQVRASDEFIVVGSSTGYLSTKRESHGICVENRGADDPRFRSRIEPGRWMQGPYFDFQLYEGVVEPIRSQDSEFSFNIPVQRNYQSWTFDGSLLLGTDVLFTQEVSGGVKLMATDVERDRVYLRNFRFSRGATKGTQFLR